MIDKNKKQILMIGFSVSLLNKLRVRNDINIYILEEEEIYKKNKLEKYENPFIRRVIFSKYLDSDEYISIVQQFNNEVMLDAVIPARDYAVKAASKIAELLGLEGIGAENGQILTNKCLLRNACEKYGIPHPRFKKINSLEELNDFFNGKPLIFKPATLQASIGISKINDKSEIEEAWKRTTNASEISTNIVSRKLKRENIVEEFIGGSEYSIETFVKNGEIIFNNITKKITYNETFVEKGHIVPANLKKDIQAKLIKEKTNFVKKMKIQSGLLHSEWKIENEQPFLIECAARVPGDYIFELIELSYGFNFIETYSKILSNDEFELNKKNKKVSSIRFFDSEPGVLKKIEGIEMLLNPEIEDWCINKQIGDTIEPVNSSWDRVGYFIVTADDYDELEKICKNVLESVKFVVG